MNAKEEEDMANRDPDNRPLAPDDLFRMKRTPQVKIIRRALGLSQEEFSARYMIPIGTLRDWEQGRAKPDQAARAYLTVIARNPDAVRLVLDGASAQQAGPSGSFSAVRPAQIDTTIVHRGLVGDRPIKSESEDVLGLLPFADALAKSLTEMAPDDGLVISVEGEWGTGKTSAIELTQRRVVTRELARELLLSIAEVERRGWSWIEGEWEKRVETRRTHLIRFNPWNFSGQENLVRAFFKEVGAVIGHPPDGAIARAIKKVTEYLPNAGTVVGGMFGVMAGGVPAAAIGATAGRAVAESAQRVLATSESLESAKHELGEALRQFGKRIIVIIDDLDRLLPAEMRAMFSLVKSLGDLPRVLYVLCFDRDTVAETLRSLAEPIDEQFLEKIIQVPLKLPPPWELEVRHLFLNRLNAIIGDTVPADEDRWRHAFLDVVASYIHTPRDVARFSNTMQVIWPNVFGDVDLTDFVILTTLQLFEPSVYDQVFENIETLAGEAVTYEDDKTLAARFDPQTAQNHEAAKKALAYLFPRLAKGWKAHAWDGTVYLRKREQRRLCTTEYYRNYFLFGRDPDRVSRAEIEEMLTAENLAPRLLALIERYSDKTSRRGTSRVGALLDQILETVFVKPLLSNAVVRAFLDVSDALIERRDVSWEIFFRDNLRRLESILTFGLEPLDAVERVERVRLISSHPQAITLAAQVINHLAGQHGLYGGSQAHETEQYVGRDVAEEAVSNVVARIRNLARRQTLLSTPLPVRLIWIWKQWSTADEVKSWLGEQLRSDAMVLRLAQVLPETVFQSGADGQKEIRGFKARTFEEILNVDEFKHKLEQVAEKAGHGSEAERIRSSFLAAEQAGKDLPF